MKIGSPCKANKQQARSEAKRAALVEAAIDAFGAQGFEGASLRDIARNSGAGLAAVSYHFGGKAELYLAAADAIAAHLQEMTQPVLENLTDPTGPAPARRVEQALDAVISLVLSDIAPAKWLQFFSRCEMENDESFGRIYGRVMTPLIVALSDVLKQAGPSHDSPGETRTRIGALILLIFSLRSQRNFSTLVLGWRDEPLDLSVVQALVKQVFLPDLYQVRG
ncbi:TetR/AcrR family transcriptional regulator [Thalassovita taeanensis]|nr:CerR family C-terminal domain-containing protein [Thalassovita taeanensis]